jgi:hypothetical protein
MRQAAAQAYLDEPQPLHRSNGDEERYAEDLAVMRAAYLRKMLEAVAVVCGGQIRSCRVCPNLYPAL